MSIRSRLTGFMAVMLLFAAASLVRADAKATLAEAKAAVTAKDNKTALAKFQAVYGDTAAAKDLRLDAIHHAGNLLYRTEQYGQAADILRTGVELGGDKPNSDIVYLYGASLGRAGKMDEGIKVLEKNAIDNSSASSHNLLTYWYDAKFDKPNMWRHHIALITQYPSNSLALPSVDALAKATPADMAAIPDPLLVHKGLLAVIANNSSRPATMESSQRAIVTLLFQTKQFALVGFEAKVLSEVATTPDSMTIAVTALSQSLKATDGNLSRVNRFLQYQKFGIPGPDKKLGTEDDLTNPLSNIESPMGKDRDAIFTKAMEKLPTDWNGSLRRAALYRYMGHPNEAAKELKNAYALCPVEQEALQKVTDQVVELLVQVSGNPDIGKTFVTYQQFGGPGPDGKEGTADDIKDPMATYFQ